MAKGNTFSSLATLPPAKKFFTTTLKLEILQHLCFRSNDEVEFLHSPYTTNVQEVVSVDGDVSFPRKYIIKE